MKANIEFVSVHFPIGSRAFFLWNKDSADFERFNGTVRWESWDGFLGDLRREAATNPEKFPYGLEKTIKTYAKACPPYIKDAAKPKEEKRELLKTILTFGVFGFFIWLVGYGVWDNALRPALGSMGLIDYKSDAQVKYEKFLASVSSCQKNKTVMAGNGSSKIPTFQTYKCPNGEEVIWSRRVEVIKKASEGGWLIE